MGKEAVCVRPGLWELSVSSVLEEGGGQARMTLSGLQLFVCQTNA